MAEPEPRPPLRRLAHGEREFLVTQDQSNSPATRGVVCLFAHIPMKFVSPRLNARRIFDTSGMKLNRQARAN